MNNYPKIYNNDIKVLGRVVSIATENKVAAAEQIFDEKFNYSDLDNYSWDNADFTKEGLDLYTINRILGRKLKYLDDRIRFDNDGWIIKLLPWKNKVEQDLSGLDSRISHLEECCESVTEILNNLPTGAGDAYFTVSPKSVNLAPGETAQITVTKGADLTGDVHYVSNDGNVATVNSSGQITAVADGTTTITVSVDGFRPTQDVTVTVTTHIPTYRVTFNPNNGQPSFYQDKLEGEKLVAVTDPVKEGYTFNGWHVNSDTGAVWNFNDPVTSTMMLIAGYTQNEVPNYTLTYKDGNTTLSTQQYEAGQSITPIADPTKSGYTFNGWNPSVPATMPANDLTVTAQWTEVIIPETHVYTLEVDPTSTTITIGNTATITATPKDNGTNMSGQTITWSSSNTSAANVSNGVVTAITEGTTTITATWTSPDGNKTATCAVTVTAEPTYTLTFDTAGGSTIAARTYRAGATIEAVTPPTKGGYNFTGWTPAIPATMPAENLTVVAQWTEVPHEYDLTISPASMSLTVGQNTGNVITATCTDNGTAVNNPSITWTSSDTSIATISGGTVNPIAAGTTVITVTWNGEQKTCSVTVSEPQPEATMNIRSNMANHILLSDGTNTYTDDNEYDQSVRQSDLPRTFTVSTDDQRWGYNIRVLLETWPNGANSEPTSTDITNSCVNGNTITVSNFVADARTAIVIELVDLNPPITVTYKTNVPNALYINYGAAIPVPSDRRLTSEDFATGCQLVTTDGVMNSILNTGDDEAATFFTVPDYMITDISVVWSGEEPAWLSDSGHSLAQSVVVIDGPTSDYPTAPSYNGSFHVLEGIKSSAIVTITVSE